VKIWITANADFPEGRGGTPRIRNLALGLVERGHDVSLFIPYAAGYWASGQNNQTAGVYRGMSFRFLNNSTERPRSEAGVALAKLAGQSKLLFKLFFGKRPHCIIIYNWSFYDVGPLVMLATALRKTVVFDVTDERFDVHAVGWQKSFLRRINAWQTEKFDRFLFRKATGFLAVSSHLLEKAKSFAGSHPSLLVPLIAGLRQDPPRRGHVQRDPVTLAYVGSFIADEGLEMLLEAVSLLQKNGTPDVKCYLIGGANNPSYEIALKKKIADLGLTESVVFIESMYHEELIDKLSTMTLLVLPRPDTVVSRSGFPGKLSEYFSARRPIVTTLFGDAGNYLVDNRTAYVCPDFSAETYARTLKRALADTERHETIAAEAYRMAAGQFDIPRVAEKVEEFVYSLGVRAHG
jgi:glycosyltransferase involved in cell wall biosynthesis